MDSIEESREGLWFASSDDQCTFVISHPNGSIVVSSGEITEQLESLIIEPIKNSIVRLIQESYSVGQ